MRLVVLGALVFVAACGGGKPAAAPAQATTTSAGAAGDDAMTDLVEHHRHHHHGGVLMFVAMSIDSLGVSPEQQATIAKIQGDLSAKLEPTRVAERKLMAALADGVTAANVDRAKIDAAIGELGAASASVHDAATDALNQLYAALTPPQRIALTHKVRAHWEVWKVANPDDPKAPDGGHIGVLAKELGLSQEQIDKVRANLAALHAQPGDLQQADAHVQDFEKGFASGAFDAKSLTRANDVNRQLDAWGATRLARFCEAATATLTPDQRTKLAAMLREHLDHNDEGRTE